jgi:hypothetical protein
MGLVTMSPTELERLALMRRIAERRTTQRIAAEQLGLTIRQVERSYAAFKGTWCRRPRCRASAARPVTGSSKPVAFYRAVVRQRCSSEPGSDRNNKLLGALLARIREQEERDAQVLATKRLTLRDEDLMRKNMGRRACPRGASGSLKLILGPLVAQQKERDAR